MKTRTDYNATLEDQIRVDVSEAKRGINELKASITELKTSVDNIGKSNGLNNFNKQIKQATGIGKNIKSILGFGTVVAGARKAWSLLKEMTNESVNFVETTNLFNVSMGKGLEGLNQYYEKAVKFQNDLQEKLGVNIAESMNYQALFNSMSKSMGISAKYAYTLSENFTKLGYDLASLYNIDPQNAMQKLRAGLAGQTKPLRDLGLDITQQSLQPIVDSLGIDRSVKNMSQAEKMILRYIAVLNQAKIAQGDFANTMDSPANQLRIFNAQVVAFKRNMGNLWQGFLGGILPYINGLMMVINELLKMVAKLFGFEVSEQKVNISANIGADDLASDLGTAGKKAKELKAQLMGFDEINNISLQDNSESGGSAGGATGTGIDQRLLDAMEEYDNLMDTVKNKATEIRDKMLEWLGFKRNDKGGWELGDGYTKLEMICDIVKSIGIAFLSWKVSKAITNLLKNLGILNSTQALKIGLGVTLTVTGTTLAIGSFKKLINGDFSAETIVKGLGGSALVGVGTALMFSNPLGLIVGLGLGVQVLMKSFGNWRDDIARRAAKEMGIDYDGKNLFQKMGFVYQLTLQILGITESTNSVTEDMKKTWQGKLGEVFSSIGSWISEKWAYFKEWCSQMLGNFITWLSKIPSKLGNIAGNIVGDIVIFFTETIPQKWNDFMTWLSTLPSKLWGKLCEIGNSLKRFFTETIPQKWNDFIDWIKTLPEKFLQFGKDIIKGLINGVQTAWNNFWKVVTDFINGFVQGFKDKLGIHSPSTVFEGFGNNIIQGLIQGIVNKVIDIKNKIIEVANGIKTWFGEKIANIKEKGKGIITKIKDGIESSKLNLRNKIGEVEGNVKDWFSKGLGNLQSIGSNIITGIRDGIANNIHKIGNAISNVATSTVGWLKEKLGIHSPSTVMRDMIGKFIPLGIAEGIDVESNSVYASIKKLNEGIKVNANDFKIDTNQYIDYGKISGAIATQTNIGVDSNMIERMGQACYSAFVNAMKTQGIKADVKVEADKDGIFKVVQTGAEEYAMQTGENPFPVMA